MSDTENHERDTTTKETADENAETMSESDENNESKISNTNLIINYLPQTMNEQTFFELFAPIGTIRSCRLMTDKSSGLSIGYGFVDFENPNDAEHAISVMDGLKIENKTIKVSYARPSSNEIKFANLYVTGFSKHMTQEEFDNLFRPFGKIITSRILFEIIPCSVNEFIKVSKGVGFVRFSRRDEAERAIKELNHVKIDEHNITLSVKFANNPHKRKYHHYMSLKNQDKRYYKNTDNTEDTSSSTMANNQIQPTNMVGYSLTRSTLVTNFHTAVLGNRVHTYAWCIYVSNLPPETEEHVLWKLFGPFGAVLNVNVVYNKETNKCKGIAFVTMVKYEEAILAIQSLNGKIVGHRKMQVSFKTIRDKTNT